jgi:uncharacterized small protein (DUF1192 family)
MQELKNNFKYEIPKNNDDLLRYLSYIYFFQAKIYIESQQGFYQKEIKKDLNIAVNACQKFFNTLYKTLTQTEEQRIKFEREFEELSFMMNAPYERIIKAKSHKERMNIISFYLSLDDQLFEAERGYYITSEFYERFKNITKNLKKLSRKELEEEIKKLSSEIDFIDIEVNEKKETVESKTE